jgi:hypothetical protein
MDARKTVVLLSVAGFLTILVFRSDAVGAEPLPTLPLRFGTAESRETPSFRRHVVPLLGRLGCNGRACHGSFQGRGGFRLSLFGYDFKLDHESLMGGAEPRVNRRDPDASLIVQKPTLRIPHEGGQRYKVGSWEHRVLLRWIEGGAAGVKSTDPDFVRLEVSPPEIRFTLKGQHAQLKAVAHWFARWSNETIAEDVTPLCRFRSNNEQIATVDADGVITAVDPGDTDVVAFYDSGIVTVPVVRPLSDLVAASYPDVPTPTEVDRLVGTKLRKLGIVPSEVCTDAEFLRRASLDVTGTLPTFDEIMAFLADKSPDKRHRKVDELLERPAYVAWWTTRLCDITGNNDVALSTVSPVDQRGSQEWYEWIRRRVRDNVPYDKIVEGIVLATSRGPGQSYTEYAAEMSAIYRKDSERSYADRPGLTHFWARRTVTLPQDKALSFAYTFLGVRIQCAECHKHPYDQWTQQDYKDFTKFFERVRFGVDPSDQPERAALLAEIQAGQKPGADLRPEFRRRLAEGKTIPFDEVYIEPAHRRLPNRKLAPASVKPKSAKSRPVKSKTVRADGTKPIAETPEPVPPRKSAASPQKKPGPVRKKKPPPDPHPTRGRLLAGPAVELSRQGDPRVPLMNWLRADERRSFVRCFVNRVWATYFNVGIVEPPDDLSRANPPSNPELLEYLTTEFVAHGYDIKWLQREIVNSRTYQLSWIPNATNRLDQRNFSHAIPRRLPAEVAYDAIRQATSADAAVAELNADCRERAIGLPGLKHRGRGKANYALNVFGRSSRENNCDCGRSNDPSLLQTIFLRNDAEVQAMIDDPRAGWVAQIAAELSGTQPNTTKTVKVRPLRVTIKPAELTSEKKVQLVRLAYLRTLSRYPDDHEAQRALAHLNEADNVIAALREFTWALINTQEFIVNH